MRHTVAISDIHLCEVERTDGLWMRYRQAPYSPDNDLAAMFTRYRRLSARPTGGEPSTGLGLSIAKRYAEAMNGELHCESEPGRGATFVLRLRFAPVPPAS